MNTTDPSNTHQLNPRRRPVPRPLGLASARLGLVARLLASLASFVAVPAAFAQSGTWTNLAGGNASGSWAAATNWNSGIIASGTDNTADFSTLDLTANSTVTLDGARTIGNLVFGDTAPDSNWILATGTGGPLTLSVTAGQPTITTASGSNTITAVLASPLTPAGLTKSGNGTLRLGTANLLTNINANVNAGVLLLAQNNALGYLNAAVGSNYVASGATLQLAAGVQPSNQRVYLSGSGPAAPTARCAPMPAPAASKTRAGASR